MNLTLRNLTITCGIAVLGILPVKGADAQAGTSSMSMDDSYAAIVIGDVKGLLDGAASQVNQVMPGMGAMIPSQAGTFLGDPQLEGFGEGDGIAALVFPGDRVVVFAEVREDKQEAYLEKAGSMGVHAVKMGPVLVFSDNPEGIAIGQKVAGDVREALLIEKPNPSLHVLVHVPAILDIYRNEIDAFLDSFPDLMKAGMIQQGTETVDIQAVGQWLEAEIVALYHLLSQVEIFEIELTPSSQGITLEVSLMPNPDTNLHRLLTTARGGDTSGMVQKVPATGAVRFEAGFDMEAFLRFVDAEIEAVLDRVDWDKEQEEALRGWVEPYAKIYGNGVVGSMMEENESGFFMNGYTLCRVDEPEECLELFKQIVSEMDSIGFSDLYKSMGLKMVAQSEEGVREYKGVRIDRLSLTLEPTDEKGSIDEEMARVLKTFSQFQYDIAIVDGFLAYTAGGSSIETLIDLVQKGGDPTILPLVARKHFGEGGSYYADLRLEGYLRIVSAMMEGAGIQDEESAGFQKQLDMIQSALAGAPPISSALFADREQVKVKLHVPVGLLQKGAQVLIGGMMAGAAGGN